jgi:hypothetical protein
VPIPNPTLRESICALKPVMTPAASMFSTRV